MDTMNEFTSKANCLTDKDIIYVEELRPDFTESVQTDAYVALLCTAGKASCTMEGEEYDIHPNDLIISHPNTFVSHALVSIDYLCQGVVMSPAYFESIFLVDGNCWDMSVLINRNPVLHLSEEDARDALFCFGMLKWELQRADRPHYRESLRHMLQMMVYEFYDSLMPYLQMPASQYGYSSAEAIFRRFVLTVNAEGPVKHEVKYYADRLCITPKYLSTICKVQTGKTASQLLNGHTVNYIRNMLQSTDKSIKEIATSAGFDNLSFFGKYVRRELGLSPRAIRGRR